MNNLRTYLANRRGGSAGAEEIIRARDGYVSALEDAALQLRHPLHQRLVDTPAAH
jgi:hypothetical protein